MNRWMSLGCAALFCLPLAGQAAVAQKPGLWVVSLDLGSAASGLDPMMIEQMKMMGLEIPSVEPSTYEVCVTPEQVKKETLADVSDETTGCRSRNLRRIGDRVNGELECNGRLVGRGQVRITLTGAESFAGSSTFEGRSQEGIPLNTTGDLKGRWLSSSCGNVQPLEG